MSGGLWGFVCLVLAWGAVGGAVAAAQEPPRWLLLPAASHDASLPSDGWLTHVARQLRRRDAYVLAFDEARALFEARGSAEPVPASAADLDTVARQAKQALWHVATGHSERARQSVRVVLERAEQALESLNREADAARNVLNACLYLVRAMLESGNRDAAHEHVLECRRLVPDITADPHDHPPNVLRLLREAELDMSTAGTGSLRVLSRPTGCRTYVNGRKLGTTPFLLRRLPPGEYRVQAECAPDTPARVHRVVLAAEPTTVRIDARFDAAVRTDTGLQLTYPDTASSNEHRLADSLRVARITRAATVLLVTPDGDGSVRLDRVDVKQRRVVASVRVTPGGTRAHRWYAARAVDSLWRERSLDMNGSRPRPMDPWAPPVAPSPPIELADDGVPSVHDREAPAPEPAAEPSGRARRVAGWALLGSGAAGLAAGWALFATTLQRGDHFGLAAPTDPDYLGRQRRFDRARIGSGVAFAAGGAITTAAVPLLLPEHGGGGVMPAWAWTTGAVGVALLGVGTVRMAVDRGAWLDRDPVDQGSTRHRPSRLLGAALWLHAAPLLAIPLTYVARRFFGDGATATLELDRHRVAVHVGGSL
jgi:hypothetical protein